MLTGVKLLIGGKRGGCQSWRERGKGGRKCGLRSHLEVLGGGGGVGKKNPNKNWAGQLKAGSEKKG